MVGDVGVDMVGDVGVDVVGEMWRWSPATGLSGIPSDAVGPRQGAGQLLEEVWSRRKPPACPPPSPPPSQ